MINAKAYRDLLDGDLGWLRKQPHSLEKMHIEAILQWSHKNAEAVVDLCREIAVKNGEPSK